MCDGWMCIWEGLGNAAVRCDVRRVSKNSVTDVVLTTFSTWESWLDLIFIGTRRQAPWCGASKHSLTSPSMAEVKVQAVAEAKAPAFPSFYAKTSAKRQKQPALSRPDMQND